MQYISILFHCVCFFRNNFNYLHKLVKLFDLTFQKNSFEFYHYFQRKCPTYIEIKTLYHFNAPLILKRLSLLSIRLVFLVYIFVLFCFVLFCFDSILIQFYVVFFFNAIKCISNIVPNPQQLCHHRKRT